MAVYELKVEGGSQRNEISVPVGWLLDETIGRPGLPGGSRYFCCLLYTSDAADE